MALVPGDEGQLVMEGGGGDEEVHILDELAALTKFASQMREGSSHILVNTQDGDRS